MKQFAIILLLCCCFACEDDDDISPISENCGEEVVFLSGASLDSISRLESGIVINAVMGTCIDVTYGVGGCSREDARARLYTNGEVGESLPTQTSVFLSQSAPNFPCNPFWTFRDTFDLSPYLDAGALPTDLTIIGADTIVRID